MGVEVRLTEPLGQGLLSCCLGEGLPLQPFFLPCLCGKDLVFPVGPHGALSPICTSVLANAEELAQQLPPPNPPPPTLNTLESREKPSGRLQPNSLQLLRACVYVCACSWEQGLVREPFEPQILELEGTQGTLSPAPTMSR